MTASRRRLSLFVRRLVERLLHDDAPLTRNRHFHSLDNPEGREALLVARRLRSLAGDLRREGASGSVHADGADLIVAVEAPAIRSRRTVRLSVEEFEVLQALPGLRERLPTTAAEPTVPRRRTSPDP